MIGVIWSDDARAREKHRSIYMPFEGPDLDSSKVLRTVQRLQARSWQQSTEACCGMTVDTSVTVNYFSHESSSFYSDMPR